MGIEFVCGFLENPMSTYMNLYLLKILTVDSFESIVWWLAKWRGLFVFLSWDFMIDNMVLSKGQESCL